MPGKYQNKISEFLKADNETVVGHLAIGVTNHQLLMQQRTSWNHQVTFLKEAFRGSLHYTDILSSLLNIQKRRPFSFFRTILIDFPINKLTVYN